MHLIVGLGNPGPEYEWSRHNLGFMLVDRLASEVETAVKRRECRSLVSSTRLEGERVRLVKPQTWMNLSGEAVACLVAKHKLRDVARQLIVISDDLALPFGTVRLRARGSAGGHKGLQSIIAALGSSEFIRLRVGIQPEHPVGDARAFVLEAFPRSQRGEVSRALELAAKALRCLLHEGIGKAMSLYN